MTEQPDSRRAELVAAARMVAAHRPAATVPRCGHPRRRIRRAQAIYRKARELTEERGLAASYLGILPRRVIGTFTYAKLPMVRDLQNADELLADSDVVAAIAGRARDLARLSPQVYSPSPHCSPPRPLLRNGGERRLNVTVTRARHRRPGPDQPASRAA